MFKTLIIKNNSYDFDFILWINTFKLKIGLCFLKIIFVDEDFILKFMIYNFYKEYLFF